MLTTSLLGRSEADALFDAWASAADEATIALQAWATCATADRGVAYDVYRASLDREEHAAWLLATAAGTPRGGHVS